MLLVLEAMRAVGVQVADEVARTRAELRAWLAADTCRAATFHAALAQSYRDAPGFAFGLFSLLAFWHRLQHWHWRSRCIAQGRRHHCDALAESTTTMLRALARGEPLPVRLDDTEPLDPTPLPSWVRDTEGDDDDGR